MPARRCSNCGTNWPIEAKYDPCPDCHERTYWANINPSLTPVEAEVRFLHARFEDFYQARGEKPLTAKHELEVAESVHRATGLHSTLAELRALPALPEAG